MVEDTGNSAEWRRRTRVADPLTRGIHSLKERERNMSLKGTTNASLEVAPTTSAERIRQTVNEKLKLHICAMASIVQRHSDVLFLWFWRRDTTVKCQDNEDGRTGSCGQRLSRKRREKGKESDHGRQHVYAIDFFKIGAKGQGSIRVRVFFRHKMVLHVALRNILYLRQGATY